MSVALRKIRQISSKTVRVVIRKTIYRSTTHSSNRKKADTQSGSNTEENSVPLRERDRVGENFEQNHSKERETFR